MRDDGEATLDLLRRGLAEYDLEATRLWAVEHVSTIYNRRFDAIQIIPGFAAEVAGLPEPRLAVAKGSSLAASTQVEYLLDEKARIESESP